MGKETHTIKAPTPLDLAAMDRAAHQACAVLRVLANPDRMMLLCQLTEGEKCVGDLEQTLGITQPTLSQQLTVLRQHRLVRTRREGKRVYYQLASAQALAIMQVLYQQFCTTRSKS